MTRIEFFNRLENIEAKYEALLGIPNEIEDLGNGIFHRYKNPILTAAHTPIHWRYDMNPSSNPYFMERFGINAVFNAGAIKWKGRYLLIARVEGLDRKSFFAVAESPNGVDQYRFWDEPIHMPQTDVADTNIYDMRVVRHEDGWIYGIFCAERRDPHAPNGDESAALAQCGIARTKDLIHWDRFPNLQTVSPQQRNVVLHPEFVEGKYAFYTRPQDGFIDIGKGGGIGFGLAKDITKAEIESEVVLDPKVYHTVYEAKNGLGPAPIKTKRGWLHLAHGVRSTAAGLRYVLYMFMTDLKDLTKVIHKPGGYLLAPEGEERIGDVSNVVFSNGWIADEDGTVYIYYASSDSRMHVARSSLDQLMDYVISTPEDGLTSYASVGIIHQITQKNRGFVRS